MNKQTIRLNNKIRRYLRNPRHEVEEKHSIPCGSGNVPCLNECSCGGSGYIKQPSTFRTEGRTPPVGYEVGMTGGAK